MLPSSFQLSGNRLSLDPHDPDFVQNPYAAYAELHRVSPAFFWEQYGHWCFAGFDAVSALLRDRRFGRQILHVATREELGLPGPNPALANFDAVERHSLLELEPPGHTKLRKLINKAFVSRNVERLRPQIEALANRLIDGFAPGKPVELLERYATPIPLVTICGMLGVPVEAGPQLVAWSHAMCRMYVLDPSNDDARNADAAAGEFSAFLREHIVERRQNPADDLLSALIAAEQDGDTLTLDELISTIVLLLNAGHEATVHQIGNAVKTIVESGRDPAVLFADDKASAATVEECLRHDAPLHMFTRYALEDLTFDLEGHPVALKKGDTIGLMLGAANRDPRRFDEPGRFDPARDKNDNVSFGAGIHFCVGAPLARLELQVALPVLFERLPGLQVTEALRYADVYHFHGLERVPVTAG
ncbi:cytochrome P450 [Oricola cellulosilytica]|nr:cytochrome P450 [Oricola cellulosilytica]